MAVSKDNPLVFEGLRRIKLHTQSILVYEADIARHQKAIEVAENGALNASESRDAVADALIELGIPLDEVNAVIDQTITEHEKERASGFR